MRAALIVRTLVMMMSAVLVTACSMFGMRSGYEQAPYTVIDRLGDGVEVRRYPPQVVAQAVVAAPDEKSGRSAAFRLLFDYISGANAGQATVAMTTPVETVSAETIAMTVPVETQAPVAGCFSMRFFLPAAYSLETAPQPTDPNVQIVTLPERTLAVLRFSGSTDAETVARRQRQLADAIEGSHWRQAGEPTAMFYDPPWTLPFLRRNEVAIPVIGG